MSDGIFRITNHEVLIHATAGVNPTDAKWMKPVVIEHMPYDLSYMPGLEWVKP